MKLENKTLSELYYPVFISDIAFLSNTYALDNPLLEFTEQNQIVTKIYDHNRPFCAELVVKQIISEKSLMSNVIAVARK